MIPPPQFTPTAESAFLTVWTVAALPLAIVGMIAADRREAKRERQGKETKAAAAPPWSVEILTGTPPK